MHSSLVFDSSPFWIQLRDLSIDDKGECGIEVSGKVDQVLEIDFYSSSKWHYAYSAS